MTLTPEQAHRAIVAVILIGAAAEIFIVHLAQAYPEWRAFLLWPFA